MTAPTTLGCSRTGYQVVYGEDRPTGQQTFSTEREAVAFAKERKRCGDVIFSIKEVASQSLSRDIESLKQAQTPQEQSDAELIVDLLEALRAVVAVADRKTVEFDKARAAIAKAEGRAPLPHTCGETNDEA